MNDTYGATAAGFGIDSARYFPEFYQEAWPTFYQTEDGCCLEQPYEGIWQGDDALWTQLAADTPPEGRNAS